VRRNGTVLDTVDCTATFEEDGPRVQGADLVWDGVGLSECVME